ncbi:hypothetical protein DW088_01340 [Butyricicoccus sp. AM05-1]|uniref:hypothetical protein n=1 Tax=Butyricicoccus sp. AM05-1 TaxID=2292004 RepID=UPI000E512927|nr:hypothetical protein [Butyricicoccus sp. AM05-1]RHO64874.1 hypothetical protein DW088_01340 [Butyricicoccus sp. AM05-1]
MNWKTSNHMDGSEIRDSIGLQYFDEGGNTSDTGADMDGFNGDDFLAALEGNDDLENQQTAAEGAEETVQDGAENQRAEEQQEEPENQPPEGGEVPPETAEQPVQTVPLVYNGQQILLPADAVQALTGALGANPVELLQKGMNYDRKAEREMRVLDQYAEAAGMNRQQYLEQLEGARNEQLLSAEIEKCRAEFPETPDAALKAIAEGRMASQRAAAAQAAEQQRARLDAMQQRIDQTVAQARQEADERAWDEYETLAGVHKPEDVPPRVMELVNSEGMTPVAAHWRYQAEQNAQAVQIEKKNNQNKMTSPGSVQGNEGDTSDPFLRGLLGL